MKQSNTITNQFSVKTIDFADDGGRVEKTVFQANNVGQCWDFVAAGLIHPRKDVRLEASKYFVFRGEDLQWKIPAFVKKNIKLIEGEIVCL